MIFAVFTATEKTDCNLSIYINFPDELEFHFKGFIYWGFGKTQHPIIYSIGIMWSEE